MCAQSGRFFESLAMFFYCKWEKMQFKIKIVFFEGQFNAIWCPSFFTGKLLHALWRWNAYTDAVDLSQYF